MPAMMKVVKFLKDALPYSAGETAGFYPDRAEHFVKAKIAEYFEPPVEQEQPATEPATPPATEPATPANEGAPPATEPPLAPPVEQPPAEPPAQPPASSEQGAAPRRAAGKKG